MKEPRIAAEIAKQLQKFHQVDIPGSKEPQLWNDVFKFLKKASVLKFEDNEKQKRYEMISFREIQDEVKELKDLSDLLHAPVVFAHNDLLSGNLMLNDLEGKYHIHWSPSLDFSVTLCLSFPFARFAKAKMVSLFVVIIVFCFYREAIFH
uniref:ethanolamine kinase n=1 Tax=Aegilops tauschii subsp. strangulata TaxID=200361 RepID=A0A453KUM9_AEGTS